MKIQLKRSNVLDNGGAKAPTAGQMEYGELAVNYNSTDPAVFLKNSNNSIIRIDGNKFWQQDSTNLYPSTLSNNVLIGGADVANPAITLSSAGDGTFTGDVSGNTGTFSGNVNGVDGDFSGDVTGVDGTFSGTVSGTTGSFSGTLSANNFDFSALSALPA